MRKLNIALVGCGRIAVKHAELLGNGQIDGARLSAVCDVVFDKADTFAKKYGVPGYENMHTMMKTEKNVDAISILTPSGSHAGCVLDLVKYKKHIIVEKPMALTLDDADAMISACDSYHVKLFVVKQNRFNVPVQCLKEALDQGRFGKLVMGTVRVRWCRRQSYYDQDPWRGTWAQDGGVFTNQASHYIDLLQWMMGGVDTVFAKTIRALVDIETEDTGIAVLKFHNGALGIIEATTATRPADLEGAISILGERGSVEVGGLAVNELKTWLFEEKSQRDVQILSDSNETSKSVYGVGHRAQYDHIVDCIVNNKKILVDGTEGRKSLEVIRALYESIKTGREISLRVKD